MRDDQVPEKQAEAAASPKAQIDRVILGEESVKRVDDWIDQIKQARPGVVLSRKDVVNWLILRHVVALSSDEVKELGDAHYDELRFLQFAMRELKKAKERGETVTLQDFINRLPVSQGKPARKSGGKKQKKVTENDATEQPGPSLSPPSVAAGE